VYIIEQYFIDLIFHCLIHLFLELQKLMVSLFHFYIQNSSIYIIYLLFPRECKSFSWDSVVVSKDENVHCATLLSHLNPRCLVYSSTISTKIDSDNKYFDSILIKCGYELWYSLTTCREILGLPGPFPFTLTT